MRTSAACVAAWLATASAAGAQDVESFYAPILQDGADPWVVYDDGAYYLCVTTGADVTLRRAPTITGLVAGEREVVWRPRGPALRELWAPELHGLDGRWYVYFTATTGGDAERRVFVLECASRDPLHGDWLLRGRIGAAGRYAIDGTVATVGSDRYLLWSGREGGEEQRLFIAPMASPTTLAAPGTRIASPALDWERRGRGVLEGPQVVVRGETVNLFYAASASWTDDYCIGLLTARVGSDLLDPASWTKRAEPLLRSGNGVCGPGHGSIVSSPDGTESWLVYHAARWPGAGWTRHVRAQPVAFGALGELLALAPAPDAPLRLPAGEPRRLRIEAETGRVSGVARVVDTPGASGGRKVGYLDTPQSALELVVEVAEAGEYVVAARTCSGDDGVPVAAHRLTVNGSQAVELPTVRSGWERWGVTGARVRLRAGENRVRFAHLRGFAEIDLVDVAPVGR